MKTMVLAVVAVLATTPAVAAPKKIEKIATGDPNRVICKYQEVLGTRLRTEKRCMTSQQWYDVYLDDRKTVERVQGGGWKSN